MDLVTSDSVGSNTEPADGLVDPSRPTANRMAVFAARTSFVLLSAAIVVVSSEKFYWYPQGFSVGGFVELALFYSLPLMVAFWAMTRYRVTNVAGVVLASGIYALGVEGVVTPVLYEDGPLPLLALYFFAWHGLLSFVFCWYLVRKWALNGQRKRLAIWSGIFGLFWGTWSATYWLPESVADMRAEIAAGEALWDPGQWPISKFALYAGVFTAVLIAAHWLIGFVWPTDWRPTRRWTLGIGALLLAGVVLIGFAVPWAPLKLGLLGWLVVAGLRRNSQDSSGGQSIFEALSGRVRLVSLAPIGLLGVGAVLAYSVLHAAGPSDDVLRTIYWTTVVFQVGVGAATVGLVAYRNFTDRAGGSVGRIDGEPLA